MSNPFSSKQLRLTVTNLLKEKRCKDTEEDYLGCIEMLQSILRTGEVSSEMMKDIISGAIANFKRHVNLGIIIRGKFSSVDCHLAARHDVVAGRIIGSGFPVMKKKRADRILLEPVTSVLPYDCIWDIDSKSVVSLRFYYIRHPDELLGLDIKEITRLGLNDIFADHISRVD
jgi:hypothetical protein